jgi:CxxC motif-containing protein
MSCVGEVLLEDGKFVGVTGLTCQRGREYAQEEVTFPKRMLTTTVRVTGGELALLPVVSRTALPKDKVFASARCLSGVAVQAPIHEGDVIYANILGLGVDIIAARDVAAS